MAILILCDHCRSVSFHEAADSLVLGVFYDVGNEVLT